MATRRSLRSSAWPPCRTSTLGNAVPSSDRGGACRTPRAENVACRLEPPAGAGCTITWLTIVLVGLAEPNRAASMLTPSSALSGDEQVAAFTRDDGERGRRRTVEPAVPGSP